VRSFNASPPLSPALLSHSPVLPWINTLHKTILKRILAQDKKWFDKSEHSAPTIVQMLIKDGDDARNLLGSVLMQAVVVTSMLSTGLVWALVRGWQLTVRYRACVWGCRVLAAFPDEEV